MFLRCVLRPLSRIVSARRALKACPARFPLWSCSCAFPDFIKHFIQTCGPYILYSRRQGWTQRRPSSVGRPFHALHEFNLCPRSAGAFVTPQTFLLPSVGPQTALHSPLIPLGDICFDARGASLHCGQGPFSRPFLHSPACACTRQAFALRACLIVGLGASSFRCRHSTCSVRLHVRLSSGHLFPGPLRHCHFEKGHDMLTAWLPADVVERLCSRGAESLSKFLTRGNEHAQPHLRQTWKHDNYCYGVRGSLPSLGTFLT